MGNLGGMEIVVILLVALIVLGPTKLPDAARQVGKAVTEVRRISGGFQRELREAIQEPIQEAEAIARGNKFSAPLPMAAMGDMADKPEPSEPTETSETSKPDEASEASTPGEASEEAASAAPDDTADSPDDA